MKIRSPLLTKLAARLAVWAGKLLFSTVRVKLFPAVPGINSYEDTGEQRFLYCTWHDSILLPIFAGRPRHMAALVSRHQDGSYLAEGMKLLGIVPVRGSTSRGGTAALKQLLTQARNRHITITPDGPRGPRRRMKPGIVFLASHTGRPIVPVLFCCDRAWRIQGSWTDLVVPKPFSTVVGLSEKPIWVPPGLSRQQIDQYCQVVQAAMDRLAGWAEQIEQGADPASVRPESRQRAAA